ncbi:GNAT family N-acetyltransferase [Pseudomonas argentinensis]|uniref:GNAT family N-acetyltransferase n=1 Tax=Phytopseudomonas argentinensis TaxID=289370 RepID=UPI001F40C39F|nr:GNAT family protein [Pseudomonas argentinensis]
MHRVHLDIEPENVASWRLAEKLGFSREGTLRDVEYKGGRYLSLHQYSLLSTDQAARVLVAG